MSDWTKILKELKRQGFTQQRGGNCHIKIYLGNRLITTLPSTCGDRRALANAVAMLRRNGFVWQGR